MLLPFRLQRYYIFSIYASPFAKKRPKAGCFSADSVSTIRQRTCFFSCTSRSTQSSFVLARMRRNVAGHLCFPRPSQRGGGYRYAKSGKSACDWNYRFVWCERRCAICRDSVLLFQGHPHALYLQICRRLFYRVP